MKKVIIFAALESRKGASYRQSLEIREPDSRRVQRIRMDTDAIITIIVILYMTDQLGKHSIVCAQRLDGPRTMTTKKALSTDVAIEGVTLCVHIYTKSRAIQPMMYMHCLCVIRLLVRFQARRLVA